jgi:hypothetical protein
MSPRNANIIACSVIIVFAILIGLGSWGVIKSPIYKSVVGFMVFVTVGSYILSAPINGLRRGVISFNAGRVSVYERRRSPIGFWFYIFLYGVVGLIAFSTGIYILFHSHDIASA